MDKYPDFDLLYEKIINKAMVRPKVRLAFAGAVAVLLIAFVAYLGQLQYYGASDNMLMSYVFEQEAVDGPVLDYVFETNGTFLN